ncbi:hypothetical protein GCM10025866_18000 [Naasia aerilata]|uniref:ABC-2 type transporter domain-containing protein n=1 Tax=Naasia aerilata TaxID=1162966 RepID=A0ABN6XLY2_9MICO|nr:hypothetical protein GCM10025866_18000 [Naasia aerilata]
MTTDTASGVPLRAPGSGLGLIDVVRRRHLLALLVRKEVQIRYRGSVLGWLWSYVKPLIQFAVFFVALGIFLRLNSSVGFYPLYLLSGITVVTFFTEAFSNGTRSIVDNAALIKKIFVPRELFPVASMLVATVNTLPQVVVVIVIALFSGWQFSSRPSAPSCCPSSSSRSSPQGSGCSSAPSTSPTAMPRAWSTSSACAPCGPLPSCTRGPRSPTGSAPSGSRSTG